MSSVRLENVTRVYAEGGGVRGFSCEIAQGEFFALLGPSGCGKTTTLRSIAGLETLDSGRIFFGDRDVTAEPPETRKAAMVFQSYALFPHLTVFENVAFGLRAQKVDKALIPPRVAECLALVQLDGLGNRWVTELSGGQQQRVALARALAIRPRILLLDEPFAALDKPLRARLRAELAELQQRVAIPMLLITHDDDDLRLLADTVLQVEDGRAVAADGAQSRA